MSTTKTGGGLQHIRDAVAGRTSQLAIMARECGVALAKLEGFSEGRVDLSAEKLQAVVKFIWQYIEYDTELDVLKPVEQPPAKSIGVLPKLDVTKLPVYTPGPCPRPGPQPEIAPKPKPKRAGWAGGWG